MRVRCARVCVLITYMLVVCACLNHDNNKNNIKNIKDSYDQTLHNDPNVTATTSFLSIE